MANKLKNKFLVQSISKLYLNDDYSDVKFVVQNEEIPAHKFILAVASPVFHAMFYGPMKEKDVVKIVDADASSFKEFLQFFYLDEVDFSIENTETVARLADKYDILDRLEVCASFIEGQLKEDNMFWGYQMAVILGNEELQKFCEKRISICPLKIFKSDAFLRCDRKVLKNLLQIDVLNCNESDVFKACLEWAKTSCKRNGLDERNAENLKSELGECFFLIRFGAMEAGEFGAHIGDPLIMQLFSRDEIEEIVRITTNRNLQSTLFKQKPRKGDFKAIWSSADKLMISRQVSTWSNSVKALNSTIFSSNVSIILGKLYFVAIKGYDDSCYEFHFKMTISQMDINKAEVVLIKEKVVLTGSSTQITLSQPITLNANQMYKVELQFQSDSRGNMFYSRITLTSHKYMDWEPEYKLNENVTVTFYKQATGLISKLVFIEQQYNC